MPILQSPPHADVATVEIRCDGALLASTTELLSVETSRWDDGRGEATLRFSATPWDDRTGSPLQAAPLGAALTVALGYHDDVDQALAGVVQSHRLMVRSSGAPEIELTVVSPTPRTVAVEGAVVIAATYGATLLELDATRRRAGAEGVQPHDGRVALHGTVVLLGTTAPQPAALMSLDGIDDAFGGPVRIIAVHQSVALGRWTTRVAFRADRG